MPPVPKSIVKQRAATLRQKGTDAVHSFYQSCVGKNTQFLVESIQKTPNGFISHGKTDHFAPIHLESTSEYGLGSVIRVYVTEATADGLIGTEIA
jgi:threonylcarbamoyladenosine tRNA methylthiotransferase MtaB